MKDETARTIKANRGRVLAALEAAAPAAPPVLIAVSKKQPEARIEAALAAGQRVFGENRVQEAEGRWGDRRKGCGGPDLELHLVGPLQTNKAESACALFDAIHSVDRPKLVRALAKAMSKTGRTPRLILQVNTGEEPQKSGVAPAALSALLEAVAAEGLEAAGLMCLPPAGEPAAPHFALLSKLADRHGLAWKSMGMSGDYPLAAKFGATHVRVGSALFGARPEA